MTVDWTGSSPQVQGAINCPSPFVKSAVHLILKCIASQEIPNFEGFVRPLKIILPEGTIVNPRLPAACAARAIVGWRAIDTLLGVFAQFVPDRVPAAGEGGVTFPAISGYHEGRRFVCSETLAGSWGAMADRDGEFAIPNPGGNLTNQPVEMIEAQYPIEIERYGMVPNSGGPGRFRSDQTRCSRKCSRSATSRYKSPPPPAPAPTRPARSAPRHPARLRPRPKPAWARAAPPPATWPAGEAAGCATR